MSATPKTKSEQDPTPWLTPLEDQAWRGLRHLNLVALGSVSKDLHRDSKLSDADYQVLTNVSEAPDRRVRFRDLVARTQWSTSRLSHHLDRMEQRGLVERQDRDDDGRGSDVILTTHGYAVVVEAAPDHVRSVRRHLFDALSADQVRQLADITAVVAAHHEQPQRD